MGADRNLCADLLQTYARFWLITPLPVDQQRDFFCLLAASCPLRCVGCHCCCNIFLYSSCRIAAVGCFSADSGTCYCSRGRLHGLHFARCCTSITPELWCLLLMTCCGFTIWLGHPPSAFYADLLNGYEEGAGCP